MNDSPLIRPGKGDRPGPSGTPRPGALPGVSRYTGLDDATGIAFSLCMLLPGQKADLAVPGSGPAAETAVLVLGGRGRLRAGDRETAFERLSWVTQEPVVAHAPAGVPVSVEAGEHGCELAVVQAANPDTFETHVYGPAEVRVEHRGKGKLDDACYRLVRTVFDRENAPEASRLVLGEVVAFPGRWSSYPPHHHPQPEVYYYRFHPPQGYGHAEMGEQVYKVCSHDLLRIAPGCDHAQAAAPGYHMYYLWAVRHLPGKPYTGFEFAREHEGLW